ncbi:transcription factor DUO1-like [Amaranthus tricolor]|uniref:transcription factor DUO1-like n=1 Tax=Amaranthus tricolor TaxID=29722 RepID=UPI002584151B|nr:transcription factor DUO1-like [Amaranthus tricolor]
MNIEKECLMKEMRSSKRYYYQNNSHNYNISSSSSSNEGEGKETVLRKGPWKEEEDQVLLKHVQKYGPYKWSSIRSKGLLQRTGKSCRLRWVNKLRPNLKNGCKFSKEEEKVVIEMQAEIGNKWARIATYLPGRTDNDVKNFWSSRQKRLARLLVSENNPRTKKRKSSSIDTANSSRVPKNCSTVGETSTNVQSQIMSYPGSTDNNCPSIEPNNVTDCLQPIPLNQEYNNTNYPNLFLSEEEICFPSIPYNETDLMFVPETQEIIDSLDYSFFYPFESSYRPAAFVNDGTHFPPCSYGGDLSGETTASLKTDNLGITNCLCDDFPSDMFDHQFI